MKLEELKRVVRQVLEEVTEDKTIQVDDFVKYGPGINAFNSNLTDPGMRKKTLQKVYPTGDVKKIMTSRISGESVAIVSWMVKSEYIKDKLKYVSVNDLKFMGREKEWEGPEEDTSEFKVGDIVARDMYGSRITKYSRIQYGIIKILEGNKIQVHWENWKKGNRYGQELYDISQLIKVKPGSEADEESRNFFDRLAQQPRQTRTRHEQGDY